MHVVVVGGGWSGLAAAVELAAAGVRVTLFESAAALGGRARGIAYRGGNFDYGQHLALGTYRDTLAFLSRLNVPEDAVFKRLPFDLQFFSEAGCKLRICAPHLPSPWHLIFAFARAQGWPLSARWTMLRTWLALRLPSFALPDDRDLTVQEWLQKMKQPAEVVADFWAPLCGVLLRTPYTRASARMLLRVCRELVSSPRACSDLLLFRRPLDAVVPEPARAFLQQRAATIHMRTRVRQLLIEGEQIRGVRWADGEVYADHVVLAVTAGALRQLLPGIPQLSRVRGQLIGVMMEPVTTVFLRYAGQIHLPAPMIGLVEGLGQWVFDLAYQGVPGRIAVVINGSGKYMRWPLAELERVVIDQLRWVLPAECGEPIEVFTLRERRAAFGSRVDVDRLRPTSMTDVRGLWLAGELVDSDHYPSSLEAAVRSGTRCARGVLKRR